MKLKSVNMFKSLKKLSVQYLELDLLSEYYDNIDDLIAKKPYNYQDRPDVKRKLDERYAAGLGSQSIYKTRSEITELKKTISQNEKD